MRKEFSFIDGDGKKVNIEVEVRTMDKKVLSWFDGVTEVYGNRLSICGDICHESSGQIVDEINPKNTAQRMFVDFWKEYHLNDMQAGTKKQMEYLKENNINKGYRESENALKDANLYEDNGYKYGSAWLFKDFNLDELVSIIENVISLEEKENEEKVDDFDINVDDDELFDAICDKFDCVSNVAIRIVALLRSQNYTYKDIDDVEIISDNQFSIYKEMFYVDEEDSLNDIAKDMLERYMWVDAVNDDRTDLGFDDWCDEVVSCDGFASIINSYDGTYDEECVCGFDLKVVKS